MNELTATNLKQEAQKLILNDANLDYTDLTKSTSSILRNDIDFADLYLERTIHETWALNESRLDSGGYSHSTGMSLRAVSGETKVLACADVINKEALNQINNVVANGVSYLSRDSNTINVTKANSVAKPRYPSDDPLLFPEDKRVAILQQIDSYARGKDKRIFNVGANLSMAHKAIIIVRSDGEINCDIRPMVNVQVFIMINDNGKVETAHMGKGLRGSLESFNENTINEIVDEVVRVADLKLTAKPVPAGMMPVILGNAWAGILLHEAVGHGLEGDFNRTGQSAFSNRVGERVAPKGVTVVDDGTIANKRGSLTCDDEGNPSQYNVLIEDGILQGYMQDTVNASLMNVKPTGNGRRQSYKYEPMPRMTNTYMLNDKYSPEEIISSVKKGLYCKGFSGGSVDITNGNFNFDVSEAYVIEDGKIGHHVKGATVIGNGPESMTKMSMVGNDLELDPGQGTCGKNGQWVPVGVGQPHCKVDEMLVGGTEI